MSRNEAIEVAKKLKALAEKAVGPEQDNAKQKLRAFCEKHDLNEDEYATEQIKVSVSYKNQQERDLLSNVMCMVLETDNVKGTDKNNSFSFKCTPYQFELIRDAFSYYKKMYNDYCEAILIAIVTKNQIINTKKETPFQMEPMTEEEKKEWEEKIKESRQPSDQQEESTEEKRSEKESNSSPPPVSESIPDKTEVDKKNERISRMLYAVEPRKWEPPRPKAKLFLG